METDKILNDNEADLLWREPGEVWGSLRAGVCALQVSYIIFFFFFFFSAEMPFNFSGHTELSPWPNG